jgi:hypothetical protein
MARAYNTFADFQRDQIRPSLRAGWSADELEEPSFDQDLDFDADPFEAMMEAEELEEDED